MKKFVLFFCLVILSLSLKAQTYQYVCTKQINEFGDVVQSGSVDNPIPNWSSPIYISFYSGKIRLEGESTPDFTYMMNDKYIEYETSIDGWSCYSCYINSYQRDRGRCICQWRVSPDKKTINCVRYVSSDGTWNGYRTSKTHFITVWKYKSSATNTTPDNRLYY